MSENTQMRQFLLFVFTLLIPCFALWTVASPSIALPAIGLVSKLISSWFPDIVNAFYASGPEAVLMTEFGESSGQLIPLSQAEYRLGFQINTRILSYSLPFYTALHFATQKKSYLYDYMWGVLILYVLFIFGLICLCLKELMVNVGGALFQPARRLHSQRQCNRNSLSVLRTHSPDACPRNSLAMAKQRLTAASRGFRQKR